MLGGGGAGVLGGVGLREYAGGVLGGGGKGVYWWWWW